MILFCQRSNKGVFACVLVRALQNNQFYGNNIPLIEKLKAHYTQARRFVGTHFTLLASLEYRQQHDQPNCDGPNVFKCPLIKWDIQWEWNDWRERARYREISRIIWKYILTRIAILHSSYLRNRRKRPSAHNKTNLFWFFARIIDYSAVCVYVCERKTERERVREQKRREWKITRDAGDRFIRLLEMAWRLLLQMTFSDRVTCAHMHIRASRRCTFPFSAAKDKLAKTSSVCRASDRLCRFLSGLFPLLLRSLALSLLATSCRTIHDHICFARCVCVLARSRCLCMYTSEINAIWAMLT